MDKLTKQDNLFCQSSGDFNLQYVLGGIFGEMLFLKGNSAGHI